MKKNITPAALLLAAIITTFSILPGCKKNGALDDGIPPEKPFLPAKATGNTALSAIISDLKNQFAQKDYSADFINWHGQPLWDKAIELKKDAANAIVLIPTSKADNIETFIAARVKDGTVVYELHRRKVVDANVPEPSGMGINAVFTRGMLAYFNNSIYNKVDQVPDAVYYTLIHAAQSNGEAAPSADKMVTVTICYNVGYCTDCPNEPQVCCYTKKVCTTITYDDGTGVIIIGTGGGPGGGGPGPGPGPGPVGCSPTQSSWYSENPVPAPCEDVNCDQATYNLINGTRPASIESSETTISETAEERTKLYKWICLINYGGWGLISREKGIHKKIDNPDPARQWEWKALDHVSLKKYGWTLGGTVETQCTSWLPTIGLYHAVMDIDIKVDYHVACKIGPAIKTEHYPASHMFSMRTQAIQGY
jgi:hypothetical protein